MAKNPTNLVNEPFSMRGNSRVELDTEEDESEEAVVSENE